MSWTLEKHLWEQLLNYRKQDKIAYLSYRRFVVHNSSILFTSFPFKDEIKADPSSSETDNSEILNLEILK